MAKKADKKVIYDIVKKYITVLKENKVNSKKVYLYGSYVNGKFNNDSDIDIAIISDDFSGKIINDQWLLMKLRRKVDLRIEPHPFLSDEWNKKNPFAKEIIETGIRVV